MHGRYLRPFVFLIHGISLGYYIWVFYRSRLLLYTYVFLFTVTRVSHIVVSFRDPGFVKKNSEEKPSKSPQKSDEGTEDNRIGESISLQDGHNRCLPFCPHCNVDIPLRAKHCKDCQKCVHRYDHHCTWLGNCIGERNHCQFYWYLLLQAIEGLFLIIIICLSFQHWDLEDVGFIVMLVVLVPSISFNCFLLVLHTYLITRNITTRELINWKYVYYLTGKDSPFNQGCFKNAAEFCKWRSKPKVWAISQ